MYSPGRRQREKAIQIIFILRGSPIELRVQFMNRARSSIREPLNKIKTYVNPFFWVPSALLIFIGRSTFPSTIHWMRSLTAHHWGQSKKCIICTTIHTANSLLTCIYDVCDHNNWYKVVVVVLCGSQFFRVRIKTGIWDACMLQNICPTECTTSETVAYLTRWLQEHFFCVQDVCGAISVSKNTWRIGTWSSCIRLANVVQF